MPPTETILADTPAKLAQALDMLRGHDVVGVDVERADWDRYWRTAALVQVGGAGRVALVDPLVLPDLTELAAFLAQRCCVLHAMDNDLGPLASINLVMPRLADTSIAAALLGLPLGLETLLEDLLGVTLSGDKSQMQRSDWEARPLTAQMQRYAAGDVADLPALWTLLAERLRAAGRDEWYAQELEAVRTMPQAEQRRDWSRTRGAGRLDPDAQGRLRAAWTERETIARDEDVAPARIAADKLLVDLAAHPPEAPRELGRRGMRRAAVRDWGERLIGALAAAPPAPARRQGRASTPADRELADVLRTLRSARADVLGIDAGVLCPSRVLLRALVQEPQTPDELRAALDLRPWQWEQLGDAFCEASSLQGPGRPSSPPDPIPADAPLADQEPLPCPTS